METRSIRTLIYLAAGIGVILSIFSGLELVYTSLSQICSFNAFFSCATVAHSGYTTILYIPDWLWGFGGFVAILAVAAGAERYPFDPRWAYALLALTTLGVGFALYFLYVELAIIGAFCIICSSSYVMGIVGWAGALALIGRTHEKEPSGDKA
jgi:uncharacterized membrane protein